MSTRTQIAGLVSLMINAMIFGFGVIAILTIPSLNAHAAILIPALGVGALVVSPVISWFIAPRLRARYWAKRGMAPQAAFE